MTHLIPIILLAAGIQLIPDPVTKDAYGPGVHSDGTGRSFIYVPSQRDRGAVLPDSTLQITPDVYGPGTGVDQYGREVTPEYYNQGGQERED